MGRGILLGVVFAVAAALPATASASWLPHAPDATWTYQWSNSAYSDVPTKEKVTVREQRGVSFVLDWTTQNLENPPEAVASVGLMAFQETSSGLVNTDWQSTPPPPSFPVLCATVSRCGNSLAGTLYLLIWGNRAPTLTAPLLAGSSWASRGGADGDVTSISRYAGREPVKVPAFDQPVIAAKVRTDITQAGALGDPYGSGVRTVWWVYGVGPVKVVFEHAGGGSAPITTSVLQSTNQQPLMPPPDANYFPLQKDRKVRYRWTNSKHLKQASVQEFVVEESVNNSSRVAVKHVSGPIRVAGSYGFTLRTDGITNLWGNTQAMSKAKFPPLGPRALPVAQRRHFFTPYDLMVYGTNPVLPAYAKPGDRWSVKVPSRDYSVYGATGSTRILGMRSVTTPAGRFNALAVQSTLRQAGFRFGSGTRTSYFVAGRGLVKLVFRHGDGSVSNVDLLR